MPAEELTSVFEAYAVASKHTSPKIVGDRTLK